MFNSLILFLMEIKKRIAIAVALVVSAVVVTVMSANASHGIIFIPEVDALADDEGGLTCKCSLIQGTSCCVDNDGTVCAPEGTRKCWKYNRNCHE